MSLFPWIVLGVAVVAVVWYVLAMRVFYRRGRELDQQVDYTKIKKWVDDDD